MKPRDLAQLAAIILAGGRGTRLQRTIVDRQKVLAEVNGRPFLTYLFDQLLHAGVRRVILSTGYMSEQVERVVGSSYKDLSISYSREGAPLGTGGAVRLASPLVSSDDVLVMNGDSFCDADLREFVSVHDARHAACTVLLTAQDDIGRFGSVILDEEGRITRFVEKRNVAESGLINAGVYLIEKARLQQLPQKREVSLELEIFPKWIRDGLYGHVTHSRFIDIGTPESYAIAQSFFEANVR